MNCVIQNKFIFMSTIGGSYITKGDFILCKHISWSSYIFNKYDILPRTYFLETCLTVFFFTKNEVHSKVVRCLDTKRSSASPPGYSLRLSSPGDVRELHCCMYAALQADSHRTGHSWGKNMVCI